MRKLFPVQSASLVRGEREFVHAVDGVDLEIMRGETLGLVGETGCGKSSLARCIARLYDVTEGTIELDGTDITRLSRRDMRPLRREVQMIFQDPYGSLNPRRRVGSIIGDPFTIHGIGSARDRKRKVQDLMELVGLNPEHYNRFPADFSGGQRQRIGVARALALKPKLLVCDEPVSALDVSIQAQLINLLEDLQAELGLTYVFITHDLSVVRHISDRISVMYLGKIVETAPVEQLFEQSRHPYTRALLSALPVPDPDQADRREQVVLVGDMPTPVHPPSGCRFHTRCPKAQQDCAERVPPLEPVLDDPPHHATACFYPMEAEDSLATVTATVADSELAAEDSTTAGGVLMSVEEKGAEPGALGPTEEGPHASEPGTAAIEGRSPWVLAVQRLRKDRVAMVSLGFIIVVILIALFAPVFAAITGHPPNEQYHGANALTSGGLPKGPSGEFWWGTDDLGRDILVRTAYGARISLLVGVLATGLTVVIGVVLGLAAGFFGGWVDTVLSRLVDVVLSVPFILVVLALVSIFGASLTITVAGDRVASAGPPSPASCEGRCSRCESASSSRPRAPSGPRTGGSCSSTSCPTC